MKSEAVQTDSITGNVLVLESEKLPDRASPLQRVRKADNSHSHTIGRGNSPREMRGSKPAPSPLEDTSWGEDVAWNE